MKPPILTIDGLKKYFTRKGFLTPAKVIRAVDGVSLEVGKGETLGIVGESGCGKSTLASLAIRLEEPDEGRILLDGIDISHLSEVNLRSLRSRMQIIFQDPYSSLDPRMTVQSIVTEPMAVLGKWRRTEMRDKALSLLEKVGLSRDHFERYPHEFSGGQRQRLSLARALTTNPEILILDEPTSALDVSVQAQVLNLLLQLQAELGLTYIFISHNLSVVKYVANRVAVMYLGKIVEIGRADEIMLQPKHPYTQELIAAVPAIGKPLGRGQVEYRDLPSPTAVPTGCCYHPRCRRATSLCSQTRPELQEFKPGHQVACLEVKNIG